MSGSRGRRPLKPVACPQDGRPLAQTDGRRLYLGVPVVNATTRDRVTLCCTRPQCWGHVTWHPERGPSPDDGVASS